MESNTLVNQKFKRSIMFSVKPCSCFKAFVFFLYTKSFGNHTVVCSEIILQAQRKMFNTFVRKSKELCAKLAIKTNRLTKFAITLVHLVQDVYWVRTSR